MWEPTVSSDELYHHGILGMKWGVRRYQNPDGTLTAEGRRHLGYFSKERREERKRDRKASKEYNYKESDAYKSLDRYKKGSMTNMYNHNKTFYGRKAANKIEYNVNVKGKDRKKEQMKAYAKTYLLSMAAVTAIAMAPALLRNGKAYLQTAKGIAQLSSNVSQLYGEAKGLNEIKGGFTLGINHVKKGKMILQRMNTYGIRF